ncbi:MAG: hypothetical protein FWH38_00350 [Treponema sp.]|nr:hypothetical protein [Treponema sp.]
MKRELGLSVMLFGFLAFGLVFTGCDDGGGSTTPALNREKAGLGNTYTFTNLQVYDENNRSQTWSGSIAELALQRNPDASNVGSVVNGKLSVVLPSLSPIGTDSGVTVTSNENDVQFFMYWAFDNWISLDNNIRYRIRLREAQANKRWVLVYADKPGIVKCQIVDNAQETYDMDLVAGWNAVCGIGNLNFVTQKGIEKALPYYDGVNAVVENTYTAGGSDFNDFNEFNSLFLTPLGISGITSGNLNQVFSLNLKSWIDDILEGIKNDNEDNEYGTGRSISYIREFLTDNGVSSSDVDQMIAKLDSEEYIVAAMNLPYGEIGLFAAKKE